MPAALHVPTTSLSHFHDSNSISSKFFDQIESKSRECIRACRGSWLGRPWDVPAWTAAAPHTSQQLHHLKKISCSKFDFFKKNFLIKLNQKQANVLEVRPVRCALGTKGWLGYASACQVRMLCKRCGGRMALSMNAWPVKRRRVGPLSRIPL